MAIRPITEYPGKISTDPNYPDGKARNVTSPGDNTGTPWDSKLVNDIFGFQQKLTTLAGIAPSGTPDNAINSQYFDALWKLLNTRVTTVNVAANANIVLTADEKLYNHVVITDTGNLLTSLVAVIVGTSQRVLFVKNDTQHTLYLQTAIPPIGLQVAVEKGRSVGVLCDGGNVFNLFEFLGGPTSQTGTVYTDPGLIGTPDTFFSPTGARIYSDGTVRGKSSNGQYIKYPNGTIECMYNVFEINNFVNGNRINGTWTYPHGVSTLDATLFLTQVTLGPESPVQIYTPTLGGFLADIVVWSQAGLLSSGDTYYVNILVKGLWSNA